MVNVYVVLFLDADGGISHVTTLEWAETDRIVTAWATQELARMRSAFPEGSANGNRSLPERFVSWGSEVRSLRRYVSMRAGDGRDLGSTPICLTHSTGRHVQWVPADGSYGLLEVVSQERADAMESAIMRDVNAGKSSGTVHAVMPDASLFTVDWTIEYFTR